MLPLSVIICTANPRMDIFQRALESVENQSLEHSRYELIVVDNNSDPALSSEDLRKEREMTLRLIREPKQGLSHARIAGIKVARGELLVFVDDDNFLEGKYLETALAIHEQNPNLGAFGGISEGILEKPVGKLKTKLLPYLGVRNYGPDIITSDEPHWGMWEPIGAGMVTRRDVAEKFVAIIDQIPHAANLGRTGNQLLSGEDSLFARASNQLGYANSYQPTLKLQHFIKKARLKLSYFAKLIHGHGRSYVVLQRVLAGPVKPYTRLNCLARLGYRLKTAGLSGAIMWSWDIGYMQEAKTKPTDLVVEPFFKK